MPDLNEKRIYIGDAVKALDEGGRVGGFLVRFTDETQRDLYGEYFDAGTEFHLDSYPVEGERVLYQHGFDDTLGVKAVGRVLSMKKLDAGLWVEAQLKLADEYAQYILDLVKEGKLGWSSGALPQGVQVDEKGYIRSWPIIEASLTPNPAMPFVTRIQSLRAYVDALHAEEAETRESMKQATGASVEEPLQAGQQISTEETTNTENNEMEREDLVLLIKDILAELGIIPGGEEQRAAEAAAEEELAKMQDEEELDEMKLAEVAKAAMLAAKAVADAKTAKRRTAVQVARNAARPVEGVAKSDAAGAMTGIRDVRDRRFDHMKAEELLAGAMVAIAKTPKGMRANTLRDSLGDGYINALRGKMVEEGARGASFVKSLPWRADELNATDIAGQGTEWVGTAYGTTLWEKARNVRIFNTLIQRGMWEQEIPPGHSSIYVPAEGSDPVVYASPQPNDLSSGRPEVTTNVSFFGTSRVQVTPGELRTAVFVADILDEDSLISAGPQVNRQMTETMEEHIEKLFINGDTATSANTNLNLIDGTPGTGTSRPYYLASNGFLKYPIITAPAYSRDAGALTIEDYRATLGLMPSAVRSNRARLVFIIDPDVHMASLSIPELATDDVRRTNATITSGVLTNLYGIDVFESGHMALANTAGKISATGGNNTKGRILLVYAPYWAFGYIRRITIEQDRDLLSGGDLYVASMRLGLAARGAGAATASYNVTV